MIYRDQLDAKALRRYASWLNGRARRMGVAGRVSADALRDRILESAGRCEWCAVDLVGAEFELDHILSLRYGGGNRPGNLALACPDCNRRKSRKHPAQFAAEILSQPGSPTPLVKRLLGAYDLSASRQMRLFERDATGQAELPVELAAEPAMMNTTTSPYTWTD